MARQVKSRPYDNSRRQAQAREGRKAVVDAAGRLFVEDGYPPTTIEMIGQASGVPIATVYRWFGSKREILKAVLETSFVGDDADQALHDRREVVDALSSRDPRAVVAGFARVCREVLARSSRFHKVLRDAAAVDTEAAELLRTISGQRYDGQRSVARSLAAHRVLRSGVNVEAAADTLYALGSPELHWLLTADRGLSDTRYERWLATTLAATLLA